jgi:hypothetical protein
MISTLTCKKQFICFERLFRSVCCWLTVNFSVPSYVFLLSVSVDSLTIQVDVATALELLALAGNCHLCLDCFSGTAYSFHVCYWSSCVFSYPKLFQRRSLQFSWTEVFVSRAAIGWRLYSVTLTSGFSIICFKLEDNDLRLHEHSPSTDN